MKRMYMALLTVVTMICFGYGIAEERTLTVYYSGDNGLYFKALASYETQYDLEIVQFNSSDEMEKRVATEMLSGQGPDVILFDEQNGMDINRLARSGMLYDLSSYFERDSSFSASDYYGKVLDAGKHEEGFFAVPFSFSLPHFLTGGTRLEIEAVMLENCSFRDALNQIVAFSQREIDVEHAIATSMMRRKDKTYVFCQASGVKLFDIEDATVQIDHDAFSLICDFTREMYADKEQLDSITSRYPNDFVNALSRIVFLIEDYHLGVNARYYDTYFERGLSEELLVYPIPAFDCADSYIVQIMEYGVVSAHTDLPDEAYGLIRHVMDFDTAPEIFLRGRVADAIEISVRKAHAQEDVEKLKITNGGRARILGKAVNIARLDSRLAEQYLFCLEHIDGAYIPNVSIGEIVESAMLPYYQGDADYEYCVRELENTLWIYLNE